MDGYFNYVLLSVIYIPLNFVDSLIICRYMEKLYGKAEKRKKFRLIQWLVILLSSFIFAPYTAVWGISVLSGLLLPFYSAPKQRKIIFHFTLVALSFAALFTAFSFGESMSLSENQLGIIIVFFPHIIFYLFCLLSGKVCSASNIVVPYKMWVPILLIPFASITGMAYTSYLATNSTLPISEANMIQFPILVLFLSVNILVFYLYGKLSELVQEKVDKALFEQQLHLQETHYEALINAHEQIRSIRHDIKNHIGTISYLAAKYHNSEIEQYLTDLSQQIGETDKTVYTGNSGIDAITSLKLTEAGKQGIKITESILIPKDLDISFAEAVILLGNLFDNAIEACIKIREKKPYIFFKLQYVNSMLYVEMKNSATDKANMLHSEKADPLFHGLGLKNIRRVVDNYNGTMNTTFENGIFIVKIVLYGVKTKSNELPV